MSRFAKNARFRICMKVQTGQTAATSLQGDEGAPAA